MKPNVKKRKQLVIQFAAAILIAIVLLSLTLYSYRDTIITVLFAQTPTFNYRENQKQTTFFEKPPTDTPKPTAKPIEYATVPVYNQPTQRVPTQSRPTSGAGTSRPTWPANSQPTSPPQPTSVAQRPPPGGGNYCAPDTEVANGCECKWSINQTGPVQSFLCTENGKQFLYFGRPDRNNYLKFSRPGPLDFPQGITADEFNKGIQGSCQKSCLEWDKPIVYLYPQTPQYIDVSLEVPGEIIKSIPQYPPEGWQNVFAYPDGRLEYEGKTYPYLFYETNAQDLTPRSKVGIFVKKETLYHDLDQLITKTGLIGQEKADFLEYWVPRLEKTNKKYIFVQILSLEEKNKIDKLNIRPLPDTFIFALYMFYPVERPFQYTPYEFPPALARTGFTAVEWGGTVITR